MMNVIPAAKVTGFTGPSTISAVPPGMEAFVLVELARQGAPVACFLSDGQQVSDLEQNLAFIAPEIPVLTLPGWDCLPYDRVSPGADVSARRLNSLAGLAAMAGDEQGPHGAIVLITVNAALQRVPPIDAIRGLGFSARAGSVLRMEELSARFERLGFDRVATVREVGEYAVRGGILDAWLPGDEEPVRLDFFGDTLESIRGFDAASQRTTGRVEELKLNSMSEVSLDAEAISRFRANYLKTFGAATRDDALYVAISEGRRFAGMEHWLPLFYDRLATVFDYLEGFQLVMDHAVIDAAGERYEQIEDHYEARADQLASYKPGKMQSAPYKPVPPDLLYVDKASLAEAFDHAGAIRLTPFSEPETGARKVFELDAHVGPRWAADVENRTGETRVNLFEKAVSYIAEKRAKGSRVLISAWTEGSLDRLLQVLDEHGLGNLRRIERFAEVEKLKPGQAAAAVMALEGGFEAGDTVVIGEQDILGDRLVRKSRRKKRAADFITEVAGLDEGSLVVHAEHGIGRFIGLREIQAAGAPHACLELHYAGDAKLFLPVENIELLSRYGSDSEGVQLDRLGGVAWQSRKAKLKKRLLDMAAGLIRIAAERHMRSAPALTAPDGLYDEFSARFPYDETEDQMAAIDAVKSDLAAGQPMDRLICGDVGFGKTEVALRAAFIAAMNGVQVAVVVPTTLLSRQHYKTFCDRLRGYPIRVSQASRLVGAKELALTKQELASGKTDIVIGTHALLGTSIKFANLGLLIVDEEQHFGVKHKERLKELKSDVHVLTLSATPIPRTLQLAMTGVRELSLITTAPVDRMAVRTFITPFDGLTVRETLMREHYRGGQSFYVCPRISDIEEVAAWLRSDVPELKFAIAHGQMPPGELDDIMNAFYDGRYDVLLSTTIVESGLDVPSANTLIVHRADMFGLAQLYQIRGRVGRSKARAFAILTLPVNRVLTSTADRRLKVLQSLDTLGAGFQLASHDLDIRGAGNLLGDEQSGHIKEVGFELYQHMLEEAVAELKGGDEIVDSGWSPQITVGTPVMIPENYVPDLHLRLGLYRRLGEVTEIEDIDGFGAELIDRFGPMPVEVEHLLKIVFIKSLCRKANVEKLDAGPKGVVVQFRNSEFPNPAGLVQYISGQSKSAKIRPDQSLFLARDLPTGEQRLAGAAVTMSKLASIVDAA